MEFLLSFLTRQFAGKPLVASRKVGCFLRLRNFVSPSDHVVIYLKIIIIIIITMIIIIIIIILFIEMTFSYKIWFSKRIS